MTTRLLAHAAVALGGAALLFATSFDVASARQASSSVAIDNDDLGGVVTGPKGP